MKHTHRYSPVASRITWEYPCYECGKRHRVVRRLKFRPTRPRKVRRA